MLKSVRRPVLAAAPWLGRFCLRWPGLVVFAVVIALSALLSTLVGPQPHAQSQETHPTDTWAQDGTVLVSTTELTIEKGKSGRYGVTLSKAPYDYDYQEEGGWWLMMVVDGMRRHTDHTDHKINYKGLTWVPSVGWEFDRGDWSGANYDQKGPYRYITIKVEDDAPTGTVEFMHELWDHDAYCPPNLGDYI